MLIMSPHVLSTNSWNFFQFLTEGYMVEILVVQINYIGSLNTSFKIAKIYTPQESN